MPPTSTTAPTTPSRAPSGSTSRDRRVPLACDMSSDILSRPVDVSKFGLIFAGAQKNLAPAGLTIAIVREDLAGHELPITPAIMNYKSMIDKDSMYNTPPCWCIYMLGLMCDWLEQQGGAAGMEKINVKKGPDALRRAGRLQAVHRLRREGLPLLHERHVPLAQRRAGRKVRSRESIEAGFSNLKGHRKVGGMRASIYNAMPVEGVEKLCDFIEKFEKEN